MAEVMFWLSGLCIGMVVGAWVERRIQHKESLRDKRKEILQHDFMRDIRRTSGQSD